MSDEPRSTTPSLAPTARACLAALGVAGGGALLASGWLPPLATAGVSVLALLALGAALALLAAARVGPAVQLRLGGRAQAARRRYRALALAALATLFPALVLGAVAAGSGLAACREWPLCAPATPLAWLTLAHRLTAGVATLLIAALVAWTWRVHPAARRAAVVALSLILLQNAVGGVQVALAADGMAIPLEAARLAHLGLGAAAWGALAVLATLAWRLPFGGRRVVEPARRDEGKTTTPQGDARARAAVAASRPLSHATAARWSAAAKDYISLTKPGVITLLIFTTLAGLLVTPAGMPSMSIILWTLAGGWLMAAGAHAVNCWADRDIDINMGRTARRPIPSGRIPAWHALALGVALGALAFAIFVLCVNWAAALLALAGYLFYVFVYTRWLKRSTPSNIVIGGAAGAFPPLVGWAAATGSLTLPSLFLFLIIFYWTPPHFWALALIRRQDYARAGVPMLPVVAGDAETIRQILLYTVQLLVITLLPAPLGMFGLPYLAAAAALGGWLLLLVVRLRREGTPGAALRLYKWSLLYLFLLFGAMIADRLLFS